MTNEPIELDVAGRALGSRSTGAVAIPGDGALHPIAILNVEDVDELLLIGAIGSATLTDLQIALASSPPQDGDPTVGQFVTELADSAGDFNSGAHGIVLRNTAAIRSVAANGTFRLQLGLSGTAYAVKISASAASATTLTIDAGGSREANGR